MLLRSCKRKRNKKQHKWYSYFDQQNESLTRESDLDNTFVFIPFYYPGQKKRTILEIRGEKNAVPRVISCSIRRDQRRASPIRDCPRLLPCADRAWSNMISHVEQRSSRRESRWWFFFLSRVVVRVRRPCWDLEKRCPLVLQRCYGCRRSLQRWWYTDHGIFVFLDKSEREVTTLSELQKWSSGGTTRNVPKDKQSSYHQHRMQAVLALEIGTRKPESTT